MIRTEGARREAGPFLVSFDPLTGEGTNARRGHTGDVLTDLETWRPATALNGGRPTAATPAAALIEDEDLPLPTPAVAPSVLTADERLDKVAADFVEHCATRWQSGKSMLVCIDKVTCARMINGSSRAGR